MYFSLSPGDREDRGIERKRIEIAEERNGFDGEFLPDPFFSRINYILFSKKYKTLA